MHACNTTVPFWLKGVVPPWPRQAVAILPQACLARCHRSLSIMVLHHGSGIPVHNGLPDAAMCPSPPRAPAAPRYLREVCLPIIFRRRSALSVRFLDTHKLGGCWSWVVGFSSSSVLTCSRVSSLVEVLDWTAAPPLSGQLKQNASERSSSADGASHA